MLFDKPTQEWTQPSKKKGPATRDWAVFILAGVTAVAMVAIALASFIYAASERQQLSELRNRTENRLAVLDQEVADLANGLGQQFALNESAKPDFAKRLPALMDQSAQRALRSEGSVLGLENVAALARQARDARINVDAGAVQDTAKDLLRLVNFSPMGAGDGQTLTLRDRLSNPALGAIGELIGYRSFLLESPLVPGPEGVASHGAMLTLSKVHAFRPLDSASKITGVTRPLGSDTSGTAAKLELMSRPEQGVTEEFRTIVVNGYDLKIDGLNARHVLFLNSRITFTGTEVELDNVYFSNCTFQISGDGRDFANALLTASGETSIVKR